MSHVVVVDDQPFFLEGLASAIHSTSHMRVTARCATFADARRSMHAGIRIVVSALHLPDGTGFDLLAEAARRSPPPAVVLVSATAAPHIAQASLRLGAAGFLLKSYGPSQMIAALARVARGEAAYEADVLGGPEDYLRLSPRERAVLERVVDARTNDEIAFALNISHKTVEAHLSRLLARTSSLSRTELAVKAHRGRWLDVPISFYDRASSNSLLGDRVPAFPGATPSP